MRAAKKKVGTARTVPTLKIARLFNRAIAQYPHFAAWLKRIGGARNWRAVQTVASRRPHGWRASRFWEARMTRLRMTETGPSGAFNVTGQVAMVLGAPVAAGATGITTLEVDSWAFRVGAHVHTLRRKYGLAIETVREPHEGGWTSRYVLRSPVSIREASA